MRNDVYFIINRADSLPIYLRDDQRVSMVYNNNIFNWDSVVGDYSYTVDFDVTDLTCLHFGKMHRQDSTGSLRKEFQYELFINGLKKDSGTFVLKKVTSKSYSGYCKSDISKLAANKDVKMNQVPMGDLISVKTLNQIVIVQWTGGTSVAGVDLIVNKQLISVPWNTNLTTTMGDFVAAINATSYPSDPSLTLFGEWFPSTLKLRITALWIGSFPILDVSDDPTPGPGYWDFSYVFVGTIFMREQWYEFLNANKGLTYPDRNCAFFPVLNTGAQTKDDLPPVAITRINPYSTIDNEFEVGQTNDFLHNYSPYIVPFPFLIHVIKKIAEMLGKSLSGSFLTDVDVNDIVLYNNFSVDSSIRGSAYEGYQQLLEFFNLKDNMPDVTIEEFIIALRKIFNLHIDDVNNTLFFTPTKEIIHSLDVVDLTDYLVGELEIEDGGYSGFSFNWPYSADSYVSELAKAIEGRTILDSVALISDLSSVAVSDNNSVILVQETNYWYSPRINSTTGVVVWEPLTPNYTPVIIGDGLKDMTPSADPMINKVDHDDQNLRMPFTDHEMNSYQPEIKSDGLGIRLLFYNGLETDIVSQEYEYGTSSDLNTNSVSVRDFSLLQWSGEKGLFNKWWKETAYWLLNSKKVKANISVNVFHLQQIDGYRRTNGHYPKIKLRNQHFILLKMEIEYPIIHESVFTLMKTSWSPA